MRVTDILADADRKSFSVEVLPPLTGGKINLLYKFLDPVIRKGIRFVNITYHAEEILHYAEYENLQFPVSRKKRPGTVGIAGAIQTRYASSRIEAVPHVICTSFTKYDIEGYLVDLAYLNIQNVLALTGDVPKLPNKKRHPVAAYPHANELIEQIVGLRKGSYLTAEEGDPVDFCIGAACYPEGHPECRRRFNSFDEIVEDELHWCKIKVDAGAEYLVTQMFFDNRVYKSFLEKANRIGIEVPILPGIRPLTAPEQVETCSFRFGSSIPEELRDRIKRCRGDQQAVEEVGIQWCVQQCRDLLHYAPGIHLFATGKKRIAAETYPVEEVLERVR
jgi:methylenetetrahydrofolate reductase (NADPH)